MKKYIKNALCYFDEGIMNFLHLLNQFIGKRKIILVFYSLILFATWLTGCKKFIEVDAPKTSINEGNVYSNDATATAVLTGVYINMSSRTLKSTGGITSLPFITGLSSDELTLYSGSSDPIFSAYYQNSLTTSTIGAESYWGGFYNAIYTCNSAIEGIEKSTSLSPGVKKQLLGESKFIRALNYFYLINLYGDVPLVLTTDYSVNATIARSPKSDVYLQIIKDLQDASQILNNNFVDNSLSSITSERVRPNKWAAKALLARAYLYNKNYIEAENTATEVISNTALFHLETLNTVFLKNSNEAIWQLQPVNNGYNTEDARLFALPETGPSDEWPVYLSDQMINSFESNDQRKLIWVGTFTDTTVTPNKKYYFPYKYKAYLRDAPVTEYATVLRLGEQYLIRAEARNQQGKLAEAADDLYKIRQRAGLNKITPASQSDMINAILHERQIELFSEWGHRWLDIKRLEKVNDVMSVVTPLKGGTWSANWQLYPIPDVTTNPNIKQNPGY